MTNSHPNEPNFSDLPEGFVWDPTRLNASLAAAAWPMCTLQYMKNCIARPRLRSCAHRWRLMKPTSSVLMQEARAAASLVHPNMFKCMTLVSRMSVCLGQTRMALHLPITQARTVRSQKALLVLQYPLHRPGNNGWNKSHGSIWISVAAQRA